MCPSPLHTLPIDSALLVPSPVVVPSLACLLAPKSPRLPPSSLFLVRNVTLASSPFLPSNALENRLLRSPVLASLGLSPIYSLCLLLPVQPKRTPPTILSSPQPASSMPPLSHYLHLAKLVSSRGQHVNTPCICGNPLIMVDARSMGAQPAPQ